MFCYVEQWPGLGFHFQVNESLFCQQSYKMRFYDTPVNTFDVDHSQDPQEHRREADRGKGGSDLAGHDAAFAHAADHQLGAAFAASLQQDESILQLLWI